MSNEGIFNNGIQMPVQLREVKGFDWLGYKAEQSAEPKPRKKRVANGQGDRSEYMRQHYQGQKERITEKNHADYIRRKSVADPNYLPKNKSAAKPAERLYEKCKNYPCFAGIENLESDFAKEGCHAFRKRENNDGNN